MFDFTKEVNACLLGIQQGDETQFNMLVNLTANHLKGVARFYLTDKSYDEDVVAEAYIHVLKYIHSYKPDKSGYTWLCKITQNMALTHNKNRAKAAYTEKRFSRNQATEYVDAAFDNISFFSQLDGLDEMDRIIAYRRYYLDESQQKIGKALRVSKVTVCNRLQKICEIVEKILKTG